MDLTVRNLGDVGIQARLDQKDLVEIVAQEAYDRIRKVFNEQDRLADEELSQTAKKKGKAKIPEFLRGLRLPQDTRVYVSIAYNEHKVETVPGITIVLDNLSRGQYIRLYDQAVDLFESMKVDLACSVGQKVNGYRKTTHISKTYTINLTREKEALKRRLLAFHKKAKALYEQFKDQDVSSEAIQKRMRLAVNKEILKAQAPAIKDKLNELMGTNL